MKLRFIFLISLLLVNCSTDSGAYRKSDVVTNSLSKNVRSPWSEISSNGSDYALLNSKTKSIFLFNSACRKFESSSLNTLTSALLTGIEGLTISEKKNVSFHEREAIEISANGKIDGVERFLKIITIQKNNCIYDYVLIATNKLNVELDSKSFLEFIERIKLN